MINTPYSRLKKLKWLYNNEKLSSFNNLEVQKFLFFSEMFNKKQGEEYDLKSLRAYKNGPVFSDTWGDFKHDYDEIDRAIDSSQIDFNSNIENSLKKAGFLVNSLSNDELIELTHNLDMWKSKEEDVKKEVRHIPIKENDITDLDLVKIGHLYDLCDIENVYNTFAINDKKFLLLAEQMLEFNEEHLHVLQELSTSKELLNPVYISIEEGVLLID